MICSVEWIHIVFLVSGESFFPRFFFSSSNARKKNSLFFAYASGRNRSALHATVIFCGAVDTTTIIAHILGLLLPRSLPFRRMPELSTTYLNVVVLVCL